MAALNSEQAMRQVTITAKVLSRARQFADLYPNEYSRMIVNLRIRQHEAAVQRYIDPFQRGKS